MDLSKKKRLFPVKKMLLNLPKLAISMSLDISLEEAVVTKSRSTVLKSKFIQNLTLQDHQVRFHQIKLPGFILDS